LATPHHETAHRFLESPRSQLPGPGEHPNDLQSSCIPESIRSGIPEGIPQMHLCHFLEALVLEIFFQLIDRGRLFSGRRRRLTLVPCFT